MNYAFDHIKIFRKVDEATTVSELVRPAMPRGVACGCCSTAGNTRQGHASLPLLDVKSKSDIDAKVCILNLLPISISKERIYIHDNRNPLTVRTKR